MYDDTAPAGDLVRGLGAHDLGKPLDALHSELSAVCIGRVFFT